MEFSINYSIEIDKHTNINMLISEIIPFFQSSTFQIIKLKAINNSITKAVLVSEVVKSRLLNIHQLLKIGCIDNNTKEISTIVDFLNPFIEIYLSNSSQIETYLESPFFVGFCYSKPYTMKELYKLNTIKSSCLTEKVEKQIRRKTIKERFSYGKEMKRKRVIYGRVECRERILEMMRRNKK